MQLGSGAAAPIVEVPCDNQWLIIGNMTFYSVSESLQLLASFLLKKS